MCLPLKHLETNRLAKGEHMGFEWEVVHNGNGYRCGYVRIGPDHPWYEKDYNYIDVDVHGGITFARHGTACPTHDEKAEWWIGFDCAHSGDLADPDLPGYRYDREFADFGDVVRDQKYAESECRKLCEQAANAS